MRGGGYITHDLRLFGSKIKETHKASILLSVFLALALIAIAIGSQFGSAQTYASEKKITRGEASLYIAQKLNIRHNDNLEKLCGLYPGIFPGDYDGKNDIPNSDKPMTTEIAIVVLVRYAGWNTVEYDGNIANQVSEYVSQEGFPYYQPDPTPRSIPYITVALSKGLLLESELATLLDPIGYDMLDKLIERLNRIEIQQENNKLFYPKEDAKEAQDGIPQVVIMDNSVKEADSMYSGEDTIIDYRAAGLRVYRGQTGVSGKRQNYFPLGALDTILSVGIEVPRSSYTHQSEGIYATLNNYSTTTNGVALWGEAVSKAADSRVWGGFLTATSTENEDAQLVGLEIDVTNHSLAGVSPNASKVGCQIVALGDYEATNALELIAAGNSSWHNGILVTENSISDDGTILGVSQSGNINTGIDFGNTDFTNAALQVRTNSKIVMLSKNGNPAAVYTDDINDGYLVFQTGKSGMRITNNANDKNLLIINDDGSIDKNCEIFKQIEDMLPNKGTNFEVYLIIIVGFAGGLGIMIFLNRKQNKEIEKLKKMVASISG